MALGSDAPIDTSASVREAEALVSVLESRHGVWAADVADFFSTFHNLKGNAARSAAWAGVAQLARRRAEARQSDHG